MGMILFTVLNAMGVIFMLYVLSQFWKEGHRQPSAYRRSHVLKLPKRTKVLVVTHPIFRGTQKNKSVIPMPAWGRSVRRKAVS